MDTPKVYKADIGRKRHVSGGENTLLVARIIAQSYAELKPKFIFTAEKLCDIIYTRQDGAQATEHSLPGSLVGASFYELLDACKFLITSAAQALPFTPDVL